MKPLTLVKWNRRKEESERVAENDDGGKIIRKFNLSLSCSKHNSVSRGARTHSLWGERWDGEIEN